MLEEIFGPVLPVLTFEDVQEALDFVNARPRPLALYLFSRDKKVQQLFLRRASFGGGCINDTIIHLATSHMGFGGVGNSGMGSYHGRQSFDTFSHRKSIVQKIHFGGSARPVRPLYAVKIQTAAPVFEIKNHPAFQRGETIIPVHAWDFWRPLQPPR